MPRPSVQPDAIGAWCGAAHPVLAGGYTPDAHHACIHQGWLYMDAYGSVGRVRVADSTYEQLTGREETAPHAFVGCQSDGFMFAMHNPGLTTDANLSFADVTQPGVVRWWHERHPRIGATSWGGLRAFAAGDQVTAWVWFEPEGPAHFMVGGPHAEHPRELPVDDEPLGLTASGARVVYALDGDVWLWTDGASAPENLTNDHRGHYYTWIDGDRVVWEDLPDPSISSGTPGLYAMDLRTRARTRVTQAPPEQYRLQHEPVVAGDWVVWTDFRNASQATPDGTVADRMEIWGYNFTTQREYPILTGPYIAWEPTILDGAVYFRCSPSDQATTEYGVFSLPLPEP